MNTLQMNVDEAIKLYIREKRDITDILNVDNRWEVFYNFAPIREGLLNWYDFNTNSVLLELGCEYGAVTSLFCRKCGRVVSVDRDKEKTQYTLLRNQSYDNLQVVNGDLKDLSFEKVFDIIVLMPSYYGDRLDEVLECSKKIIKPDGRIIIVAENSLGVNIISGKTYCDAPFAAFGQDKGRFYSREDLEHIIQNSELKNIKWFYPMPDYIIPQEIYTDASSPENIHTDRILDCFPYPDTIVINPKECMRKVIENNLFTRMANSFIVECSLGDDCCNVTYAALSTDREKEAAYITKITNQKIVVKEAIYVEGVNGINALYENISNLQKNGVPVLPHEIHSNYLTMPFIKEKTLMQYIIENAENQETVKRLIGKVYNYILMSSEHVSDDKNAMLHYDESADWGVILKNAYIDMIPFNCFYIENDTVFFDQEFCMNYYPAKYIVFRMFRYIDLTLKNLHIDFDLEGYCKEYGLTTIWKYCLQEEDKFIYRNRNHHMMKHFYEWINIDENTICNNISRLKKQEINTNTEQYECETTSVPGVLLSFDNSFYSKEKDEYGVWRWCNSDETIVRVINQQDNKLNVELEFELVLPYEQEKQVVDISICNELWGDILVPTRITIPLLLAPCSETEIRIKGRMRERRFAGDSRSLFFQFRNYKIDTEKKYIGEDIEKVRQVQLRLLNTVNDICNKNNLQYYAVYGSLLGTIRNGGYIPWDDDIDIAMPREDYDRFLEILKKHDGIDDSIFLQNMYTDKNIFFGGYSKLRDSSTTGIFIRDYRQDCNHGIWIDIFPLDNHISDIDRWSKQYKRIRRLQRIMFQKVYGRKGIYSKSIPWNVGLQILSHMLKWEYLCKELDKEITKYNNQDCTELSITARMVSDNLMYGMNRAYFSSYETRKFEDTIIRIPIFFRECLTKMYGFNYMVYPEEVYRKPHKDVYFNVNTPFEQECEMYRNEEWEK